MVRNNIVLLIIILACNIVASQTDAYYVNLVAQKLGGTTEVKLDGGRADIVTDMYAIEVEFAPKWKESLGQALFYAQRTNKKAGIVIIMKSIEERKYALMLQTTKTTYVANYKETRPTSSSYTKNTSSGVRHNSSCRYADCKNCVPCSASDGRACGKCGG
jgi:hypothetical protein